MRWKHAYYQFFVFQLIHICAFYFLDTGRPDAILLFGSGSINIIFYTRLLLSDIRYGGDDINPIWFYIGMSILRMGIAVLYIASIIWFGEYRAIMLGKVDAGAFLMDGHLLLLIGDLCFIAGYFVVRNNRHIKRIISKKMCRPTFNVYKAGLILALCGFGLRILQSIVSLGGLGQIVGYVSDYGIPAGIFLMFDYCRRRKRSLFHHDMIIPLVLLGFAVVSGLSSYMKTDLLISLFPLVFMLLDSALNRYGGSKKHYKLHLKYIASIGLIGYFFLFTVSAYSELHRKGFWENMGVGEVIPTQSSAPAILPDLIKSVKGSVPGTEAFTELQRYPDHGVWHMVNRLSVTPWAATSIKLVEMSGTRQDSMLGAILLSITPRILYPDKPQLVWGREVAVELGQARSVESASTSTGLTMYGFLYWWGGYGNMMIMALLSGAGFAFVYLLFVRDWRFNPISALVIMALSYNGFHWKESDVLGGFPFYLYMLIVFFPLARLISYRRRPKVRKRNPFRPEVSIGHPKQ